MPPPDTIAADLPLWWCLFVGIPALSMMTSGLERRSTKIPPLQVDSQLPEPGSLRGNRFRQRHFWERPRHGPLAPPDDQA